MTKKTIKTHTKKSAKKLALKLNKYYKNRTFTIKPWKKKYVVTENINGVLYSIAETFLQLEVSGKLRFYN